MILYSPIVKPVQRITRRSFVAAGAVAPLALRAAGYKTIPVGLELFSVRGELGKDLPATVTAVAKMGYQVVEFFAPYYEWTEDYARQVRKQMDDLGIRCNSTHNSPASFSADGMQKAIDLNGILGTKFIVMASAGRDGWLENPRRYAHPGCGEVQDGGLAGGLP